MRHFPQQNIKSIQQKNLHENFRCDEECDKEKDCCSYEWSPSRGDCNLNKECEPTKPKYFDFLFCQKIKTGQ